MDYTKIPKELIYQNRNNLEEFTDGNDLNAIIVENMEEIEVLMEKDFESRALLCMNTAYYICTMMMLENKASRRWSEYREIAACEQNSYKEQYKAVVLSIVTILLRHYDEQWLSYNEKFIGKIEDFVKDLTSPTLVWNIISSNPSSDVEYERLGYIYVKLSSGTNQAISLSHDEFKPRPITYWTLSDNYNADDLRALFGTDEDKILDFIYALGKTEDEQNIIASFMEDQMVSLFPDGWRRKAFFDYIRSNIHKKHHGEEERARDQAEFEAYQEQEILEDLEAQWNKERVQELEKENLELRAKAIERDLAKAGFYTPPVDSTLTDQTTKTTLDEEKSKLIATIEEQEKTIKELTPQFEDLKQKFSDLTDNFQKKQKQFEELTVKFDDLTQKFKDITIKYQQKEKELEELRSQQALQANEATTDEIAIELLTPLFEKNNSETARSFYHELSGKDDIGVAEVVASHKKDFSLRMRNVDLWRILHAFNKYSSSDSNFNTALRKLHFRGN